MFVVSDCAFNVVCAVSTLRNCGALWLCCTVKLLRSVAVVLCLRTELRSSECCMLLDWAALSCGFKPQFSVCQLPHCGAIQMVLFGHDFWHGVCVSSVLIVSVQAFVIEDIVAAWIALLTRCCQFDRCLFVHLDCVSVWSAFELYCAIEWCCVVSCICGALWCVVNSHCAFVQG